MNIQPQLDTEFAWVHQNCALWLRTESDFAFDDMIFDLSQVNFTLFAYQCDYCQIPFKLESHITPKYKCSNYSCKVSFHIECARSKGMKLNINVDEDSVVYEKLFCKAHEFERRHLEQKEIKRQKERDLINFARNLQNIRSH